jgi:molybdopterin-guanine dinucleotide biosynthesis protein A
MQGWNAADGPSPTRRINKALLPWADARLIDAVVSRLAPQCTELCINTPDPLEGLEGFKRVVDTEHRGAGPLAGILAGLQHLQADPNHYEWLLSVPCDSPHLPLDLADQLARAKPALSVGPIAAVPLAFARIATTNERSHPVIGLWHISQCAALAKFLGEGGFKVHAWVSLIQALAVVFPDEAAFANLNTPEQWATSRHPSGL